MKYFVVVLALVALVAAEELDRSNEPYYAIHMACVRQSGITPEQAEKIAVFDYPDEEQVHKYILCGASKVGVVDDPQMEKALEECARNNASHGSHQVVAYHTFQCMLKSEVGETLKKGIQRIQTKPTNA